MHTLVLSLNGMLNQHSIPFFFRVQIVCAG